MPIKESPQHECLLLVPHIPDYRPVHNALREAAKHAAFHITTPKDMNALGLFEPIAAIHDLILRADIVVADLSLPNPNIAYEVGIAHSSGKPALLLAERSESRQLFLPDAPHLMYERTQSGLAKLEQKFRGLLEDFKKSPRSFAASFLPMRPAAVPFIDLGKLEPREFENLCFELLTQIGFRRVEWEMEVHGIDAVASLRKKDPDGFDYQELWLISFGTHAPFEMLFEMAGDPEFLFSKILGRREFREMNFRVDTPPTFLFIPFRGEVPPGISERDSRRRLRERTFGRCRVRVWNTEHLVNLIQQYPQLAQKYFSEQGRAQSQNRKTAEELYAENVQLTERQLQFTERQQALIAALQEEKEKRARAERDAVWKDLSFTAAHKLGNPVFALETDLQALKRRIADASPDAAEVADEMGSSIEKAKSIIEQFKSLTKAQDICPQTISISPLILAACRVAEQNGVQVQIQQPEQLPQVLADSGRMTECFDELVANSLHWLDKPEKKIFIVIDLPKQKELPESLEHGRPYMKIVFADNGCGVRADLKRKIFNPFFTTHPHGTGLGLSLVERIVEGHGGSIVENGKPGEGASFEIFLPILPKNKRKES